MKQITIAGNLTKDAEIRTTGNGDKVCSFSVAVNDRNKKATYFDVGLWGRRGEALCQYLRKGNSVCVSGDLWTHENNGKTYLKVSASDVTLLGGKRDDQQSGGGGYTPPPGGHGPDMDDEIPFAPEWRG